MSEKGEADYSDRTKPTESDQGAVAKVKDPIKHFSNLKRSMTFRIHLFIHVSMKKLMKSI